MSNRSVFLVSRPRPSSSWRDRRSQPRVRREHSMEPRQVYPRRRHQRRKASDEVQRLQHDVRRKLERYKDWANYERLRTYYVEAAYRNLLTYR